MRGASPVGRKGGGYLRARWKVIKRGCCEEKEREALEGVSVRVSWSSFTRASHSLATLAPRRRKQVRWRAGGLARHAGKPQPLSHHSHIQMSPRIITSHIRCVDSRD